MCVNVLFCWNITNSLTCSFFIFKGNSKVLVTGPWYSTTSPYTVLFDGVTVTATLVQSGVLRCYCPRWFHFIFILLYCINSSLCRTF